VFFSVINNGHPTACGNAGCAMSFVTSPWQASTAYQVGQEIMVYRTQSGAFYLQTVVTAGTTAATPPAAAWPTAGGGLVDGTVHWLGQGPSTVSALAAWAAGHAYGKGNRIIDGNGDVEIGQVAGTSGTPNPPAWATTAGATTPDGTATWVNAGVLPSAALPATAGTSGIIIDNTVSTGTLTGASELYFSALGNEACPTTSTGCAVQASQSQLK